MKEYLFYTLFHNFTILVCHGFLDCSLMRSLHTNLWFFSTSLRGAVCRCALESSEPWQEHAGTPLSIRVSSSRALSCLCENASDASSGDCFACSVPQRVKSCFSPTSWQFYLIFLFPIASGHCFKSYHLLRLWIICSLQLYCYLEGIYRLWLSPLQSLLWQTL